MNRYQDILEKDGFAVLENTIDSKLIKKIQEAINIKLIEILINKNMKDQGDLNANFYKVKTFKTQYEIQKLLSQHLLNNNLIHKIFDNSNLMKELIFILGPDIEFMSDYEMAINAKNTDPKDHYLLKKYHQEFWSGMGLESLQLWIPIQLTKNMGTLEMIKGSHKWGHIPHRNREPAELPNNYETKELEIKEGSIAVLSALTLHRTVKNNDDKIRIALPITVRNFYYPNTGNSDLFNFIKVNNSYFTRLRKILGNPHFSPFRTLEQKKKNN